MKIVPYQLFFCCLLFHLSNGQTCTSPAYSNSRATIKGPCPSTPIITPVGSTNVKFECFLNHSGGYLVFWNVTGFPLVLSLNPIPSGINFIIPAGSSGITSVTIKNIGSQKLMEIQCGLCNSNKGECIKSSLRPTVISLPVQLISFGK